jgi:hypothetical protein
MSIIYAAQSKKYLTHLCIFTAVGAARRRVFGAPGRAASAALEKSGAIKYTYTVHSKGAPP